MVHLKCRNGIYPLSSMPRTPVPDGKVSWSTEWADYSPTQYTSSSAINKPWADSDIIDANSQPKWNEIDGPIDRRSHMGPYLIVDGHPRNPMGRTGIVGRGLLGRWGPNHAADPIVTRWKNDESGQRVTSVSSGLPVLQFVSIQRRDSGEWAIPGGMIDPGELVTKTLAREFSEEALNTLQMSAQEKTKSQEQIGDFFRHGTEIYRGYVDDPRNTDNCWMETVAYNFHDDDNRVVGRLRLSAGDDAMKVKWMDVDSSLQLYASHTQLLKAVADRLKAHW